MLRLNYRVELHYRKVYDFIVLCQDIGKHDLKLGDLSPLKDMFDMDLFRQETADCENMHYESIKLHNKGENNTEKAYQHIGVYKGQNSRTPDTLYSMMYRIRLILSSYYYNNNEQLQHFGFAVVQGKRSNNVKIPSRTAYKVLKSAKLCLARHQELGKNSPLLKFDMKTFESHIVEAELALKNATESHDKAESVNERLYKLLGFAKRQGIRTPNTLYYKVGRIRNLLLTLYFGQEKQLEAWGFKVVISSSKRVKKDEKNSPS